MYQISGQLFKELTDYLGQVAGTPPLDVIPDGNLPAYSDFSAVGLVDDWVPAKAIAYLTEKFTNKFVYAEAESTGGYASLNFTATRAQKVLVVGQVERTTTKSASLEVDDQPSGWITDFYLNLFRNGGQLAILIVRALNANPQATFYFSEDVKIWRHEDTATLRLLHEAVALGNSELLEPEGTSFLFGVSTTTVGSNTFSIDNSAGSIGSLKYSKVGVVSIDPF